MVLSPLEIILLCSTILELNPLFQAVKSIRTKSAKDISPLTFATILAIGALWLVYGFSIDSIPVIVGNILKLVSALIVLIVYMKYKEPVQR